MDQGRLRALGRRIAALLVAFCGISSAYSQAAKQHARLSLVSDRASFAPGSSQWIGLRFELEPGWHIYWTNPGDSGEPPKVSWHLPSGVEASDLQFPAPQRIADHGLMDYGYQGHVVLLSKLTVPASVTSKKAEIAADVRYLVCREVCVPAREHVALMLTANAIAEESSQAEVVRKAMAAMPQPLPTGVRASATPKANTFVVSIASKRPDFGVVSDFIPSDTQIIENTSRPVIQLGPDIVTMTLKKSEQLTQPISTLRGLLIAKDKAYEVNIPVTASKNSGSKGSSKKAISQKVQAPTSN